MIAIHLRGEPQGFTPRWIECCREWDVQYRTIDAFASDAIEQLRGCQALLWYFDQNQYRDLLAARHLLRAAADSGIRVFPDLLSAWHFDDKIAQKYIFEALELPHVPTHCFYFAEDVERWLRDAPLPFVWKLRRGAGAGNVRLVRTRDEAERLCRQAFGPGFNPVPPAHSDFRSRASRVTSWSDLWEKLKRRPGLIRQNRDRRGSFPREISYFLAQDFVPDNDHDTRVTVIREHAWAFRRAVRTGDFRASGSGVIDADPGRIDPRCVGIARQAAAAIGGDCLAFDFVHDAERGPLLVEMSYSFVPQAIADCPGHWDPQGSWIPGSCRPEDVMLRGVLEDLERDGG